MQCLPPPEAFDMLVRTLARICDDPYDPVFSAPVPPVPGRRVADLTVHGDHDQDDVLPGRASGTRTLNQWVKSPLLCH